MINVKGYNRSRLNERKERRNVKKLYQERCAVKTVNVKMDAKRVIKKLIDISSYNGESTSESKVS